MAKRTITIDDAKDQFQAFDLELFDYTVDQLAKYGYDTIKAIVFDNGPNETRKEQILAINKKDELRFIGDALHLIKRGGLQDNQTHYTYTVKKRSTGAGYVTLLWTRFAEDDLPLFSEKTVVVNSSIGGEITTSSKAIGFFDDYKQIVVRITETGSQEPRTFKSTSHYLKGEFIAATSQIKMARVVSLVTLNDGFNRVNISQGRIQEPDTDCWFLMDCAGHRGATFNLITDGERFHPVARVNSQSRSVRIEKNVGKATVNADFMDAADQELIHMAIKSWVAEI